MSPRWLFFPAPSATSEIVGTTTGWVVTPDEPIRSATGWSAGPYGANSVTMYLRGDSFGAFLQFNNGTNASAFVSANGSRDIVIDHSSGTYTWDNSTAGGMSIFATVYVRLSLSGWSGTLPGSSDASTISLG